MMHMFESQRTFDVVVAYVDDIFCPNGEKSLNKLLSPDLDPDRTTEPRV